mgnify:CR=1 FL=1
MCPECGDFNYAKRFQTSDLKGQVAVVTGSRLKIGYHIVLMLLRSGATVVATTRFPIDSALRYSKDNNLVLDGNILINVYDVNEFYKFFQTPRNYRKEIKEIRFNFVYNFDQKISNLNNIEIDGNNNQQVNQVLNQIILKETFLQNRVYFKNLINKAIKFYAG